MTNVRLPAKDAADLVNLAKNKLADMTTPDTHKHDPALDIDNIYVGLVPESAQDSDAETIVDITEITEEFPEYGSNLPTNREQRIAINIFYGIEKIDYMDLIEKEIESVFLLNNWQIIYSQAHVPDPDTGQETKIYQFSRTISNDFEK